MQSSTESKNKMLRILKCYMEDPEFYIYVSKYLKHFLHVQRSVCTELRPFFLWCGQFGLEGFAIP